MECLPAIHVRSLANCQRLMASNPKPIHCVPSAVYGSVAGEGDVWRAGGRVEKAALAWSPQLVSPTYSGVDRCTAHKPAVPRDRGVIEQVVLDDVVELLRGVLR